MFVNLIDEPVFFVDAPRPATGQVMLKRLRFAYPRKRVVLDLLNKLDNSQSLLAVLLNPPSQVIKSGWIKFQAAHERLLMKCLLAGF